MAMIKCRECGKEVSSKAGKCPHCGVSTPAVGNKEALLGCLFIVVLVGGCSALFVSRTSDRPEDKLSEEECAKELSCMGERYDIKARSPCIKAVESLANYTFRWVDGTLEMKFPRYRWGKVNETIVYIGDAIELQNGFGAYQRHTYSCEFDPRLGIVVDASATPGRLPELPRK